VIGGIGRVFRKDCKMKRIGTGAVLCLSICMGLIPSCKSKEDAETPAPRAEHEVIITLKLPPETAPASGNRACVTIDSRLGRALVPARDRDEIRHIVRDTWIEYKTRSVVVIKAHPDELCDSVMHIIASASHGTMHKARFEAGDVRSPFTFSTGLTGSSAPFVWNTEIPGQEHPVHTVYILDGEEAGWFAIWNDKFKGPEALTEALVAIKTASGEYPPKVTLTAEPKASWGNYVLACKAATDAKIEYPGLSRNTREHHYISETDLPGRKRRRPRKPESPGQLIPYEESSGGLGIPNEKESPATIIPGETAPAD
jgi:hypothetical protein